ncbi:serine hydrolase domain-containing protein [Qipengyuania sediminis]|uniref:serine hydrolase domain-containing protein n=1 Tax=Qipengyuania sediminis TaxID=1532023 RepID=UPI00105A4AE6|nr:serine hydrolase domain-containing protein [Qipengyuania sediminis]
MHEFDIADPAELGFDPGRLARIDSFLEESYVGPGKLPGTQILVARDGRVVHFGQAGVMRADGTPMRADALLRIASMTKPVTSVAFMQLVEQARVALDEPIGRVLPELAGLGVYAGGGGAVPFAPAIPAPPIRFVDLMTHMSGLTYGLQNRTSVDAAYREIEFDFARGHHNSDEYLAHLGKLPLEFAPGTGWNYSVATDVLGIAIERISGQRLGDYFRDHIFAPLGMTDTGFDLPADGAGRLADAWTYQPGSAAKLIDRGAESKLLQPARFHSGGGGLIGTIADYHRFASMLLNRGELGGARILAPKTLALMTRNFLPGGADLASISRSLFSESTSAGSGFGLGFATVIDPAKTLMPASEGEFYWGGAYSTAFFVDPLEGVTMVFMTQLYPSSAYPVRRQLKILIYAALMDSRAL